MNPCCHGSLQTGTKIVAIVYMVLSSLLVILGVLGLCCVYFLDEQQVAENNIDVDSVKILSCVLIAFGVIKILLSTFLFIGAKKRNQTMCLLWFVHNVVIFVVVITWTHVAVWYSEPSRQFVYSVVSSLLLKFYCLSIVWAFVKELNVMDMKLITTNEKS